MPRRGEDVLMITTVRTAKAFTLLAAVAATAGGLEFGVGTASASIEVGGTCVPKEI